MYKSKTLNLVINSLIIIISLITTIYLFKQRPQLDAGYENIYLLPLAYLICHILFIRKVMKNYGISMFLGVYITVSFFRYVVLSFLVVLSRWFYGRAIYPPEPIFYKQAIIMMIYELLIYNIAILLFHKFFFKNEKSHISKNKASNEIKYSRNNLVYIVFIAITFILIVIRPNSITFFSFLSVNKNYTGLENADTLTSITTIFLNTSRILIYIIIVRWCMLSVHPKNPILSFVCVTLITVLNSLIFFGTNRADFVFNFIVNLVILIYLYKKLGIGLSCILILFLPIVVSGLSSYRNSISITKGANKLIDFTDNIQVYLGGVYNVALSLDLHSPNSNPLVLFVDIFRSAFGPNLILKHINIVPSVNLFNNRIYLNDHVAQIIPMIGQSNLYLGQIFAPVLGVSFIFLGIFIVKELVKVKRLELIYVLTLFSGRLGFVMAQNGNIFLNDLTFFLPLFLIIYYLNNKVVGK
ncbi:O-antigen polymerase [Staphylococcus hominis]|uniref:O-antigen polymerase n=1 Tax=Staphylococcus hominis TaxID=1290 RepID=UPI001F56D487|nr:O-antigen polymerase [Staphylococcus hominis]MCI2901664.1 O-antigen polysaccharide polymerase Wzy [Staphylococcus hominis]